MTIETDEIKLRGGYGCGAAWISGRHDGSEIDELSALHAEVLLYADE